MIKSVSTFIFLIFASLSLAQISDEYAIERARSFLSVLAPEKSEKPAQVTRESIRIADANVDFVRVYIDEAWISLQSTGRLSGISIGGEQLRPRGGSPDKYRTDEEAWNALDEVINRLDLDLPPGLKRSELTKLESDQGQDYAYLFYMRPDSHGYENSMGNYLAAELHRITGKVLHISVARGHTYEAPNIRITEEQAVAKAVAKLGGSPADFTGRELKYFSMSYDEAPDYFKELIRNKVMRLMYLMSAPQGTAMIDSVTGDLVTTMHIDSSPGKPVKKSVATSAKLKEKVQDSSEQSSLAPIAIAGLVALFAVAMAAFRMRSRRA